VNYNFYLFPNPSHHLVKQEAHLETSGSVFFSGSHSCHGRLLWGLNRQPSTFMSWTLDITETTYTTLLILLIKKNNLSICQTVVQILLT